MLINNTFFDIYNGIFAKNLNILAKMMIRAAYYMYENTVSYAYHNEFKGIFCHYFAGTGIYVFMHKAKIIRDMERMNQLKR